MATFDIEHRINRRQAELADARSKRLARRGVAEADLFSRPRPQIITADQGQIPDSAFRGPSFANVESASDTVAGTPVDRGPRRRGGVRTDVAPGAGVTAPNLSSTPQSEGERKKRLGAVEGLLRSMRTSPSGLNMASKRRLFGELVGEANDLTTSAYDVQSRRDVARAQTQGDAAQASGRLAESAADRRDRAAMFDTDMGDRRFEYDTDRRDAYDAAIAAAPRKALEMEKLRTEIAVDKANATRIGDEYTRKAPGIGDEVLMPRIAALREANPGLSYEDARAQAVAAYQAAGADAEASTIGSENRLGLTRRVSQAFDPDGLSALDLGTIGDDAAIGSRFAPDQVSPGAIEDPRGVRATRNSLPRRLFSGRQYRLEVPTESGARAVYSNDDELFNDLQEYQRAFRGR